MLCVYASLFVCLCFLFISCFQFYMSEISHMSEIIWFLAILSNLFLLASLFLRCNPDSILSFLLAEYYSIRYPTTSKVKALGLYAGLFVGTAKWRQGRPWQPGLGPGLVLGFTILCVLCRASQFTQQCWVWLVSYIRAFSVLSRACWR